MIRGRSLQSVVLAASLSVLLMLQFLTISGCSGTSVEVVSPSRGKIQESFTEPAKTRLSKTYRITMPVSGRIARIDWEPKDTVTKGRSLVDYDRMPFEQAVEEAKARVAELEANIVVQDDESLEQTALVDARSAVNAATEALKASREQVAAEKARWKRADKQLKRMQELLSGKAIAQSKMDDVNLVAETALIDLKQQEFYLAAMKAIVFSVNLGPLYVTRYLGKKKLERKAIVHQLAQAKARLAIARHDLHLAKVESPIDGIVLEKYEQGDSTLPAGEPLLLLGNLKDLEAVAEVLSQDALKLSKNTRVRLEPAIGLRPIAGKVKRVDPAGFTKLSSLGVEQQRVKVIVSISKRPKALGVAYRVQARFFTGVKDDALIVSRFSVLQAPNGQFYVYKVHDDRLVKQSVKLGLRNDLQLEVTEGLTEKDVIVSRPDTTMNDGMKIDPIQQSGG